MDLEEIFGVTISVPKKKAEKVKVEKAKTLSPFDYITLLTTKKTRWDALTSNEQKGFQPFIVTKMLSYDHNIIDIVNYLAKYTMGGDLSKEQIWGMFYTILPKMRLNISYIKKVKKDKNPLDDKYIECLMKQFHCSKSEAEDYMTILEGKIDIDPIKEKQSQLKKYGYE